MTNQKQVEVWADITEALNAAASVPRTVDDVKTNMVTVKTQRSCIQQRQEVTHEWGRTTTRGDAVRRARTQHYGGEIRHTGWD